MDRSLSSSLAAEPVTGAPGPAGAPRAVAPVLAGAGGFLHRHAALLGILALAVLVRLPTLLGQSYWIDELITVGAVPMSWGDMYHRLLFGGETHPLLYCTLLKLWTLLFGTSKLALRLFSVTAGTLFVLACHRLTARLLSPRLALATALLAALSPYALYYSQEVRSYMLFGLLCTASYGYFYAYVETRRKRDQVLWILVQAAAFHTHVYGAFVLAAQCAYVLHRRWRRGDRALLHDHVGACLLLALSFLPWMGVILVLKAQYLAGTPLGHQEPIGLGHFAYAVYALFLGYSLGPSVEDLHRLHGLAAVARAHGVVTALAILSLLPLLVLGVRRIGAMPGARVRVALGAGVPLAAAFGVSLLSTLALNVRFLIPVLPFFLMVLAAGLGDLLERGARAALVAAPFAVAVVVSLGNYYTNPKYWREDYERTATYLHQQREIRVLAGATPLTLQHFLPDMDVEGLSRDALGDARPGERRWLVWNRTWMFDRNDRLHQQALAGFRLLSEQRYSGFLIELVEKK
jgi:4-amino-4-deoxy-L-arabinose transferase-like glycosyltransferase